MSAHSIRTYGMAALTAIGGAAGVWLAESELAKAGCALGIGVAWMISLVYGRAPAQETAAPPLAVLDKGLQDLSAELRSVLADCAVAMPGGASRWSLPKCANSPSIPMRSTIASWCR